MLAIAERGARDPFILDSSEMMWSRQAKDEAVSFWPLPSGRVGGEGEAIAWMG